MEKKNDSYTISYYLHEDENNKNRGNFRADLSGFEPESEAPEASVISKLHYRPKIIMLIC